MAFTPIVFDSGKIRLIGCVNSTTITKGNALVDDGNGLLTNASAGGGVDVCYVAMETVTTTSAGQKVLCIDVRGVIFEADCDAAWSTTDLLTAADLATAGTLDPDASSDDIFMIESGVGVAETGTKVRGYFVYGAPQT